CKSRVSRLILGQSHGYRVAEPVLHHIGEAGRDVSDHATVPAAGAVREEAGAGLEKGNGPFERVVAGGTLIAQLASLDEEAPPATRWVIHRGHEVAQADESVGIGQRREAGERLDRHVTDGAKAGAAALA